MEDDNRLRMRRDAGMDIYFRYCDDSVKNQKHSGMDDMAIRFSHGGFLAVHARGAPLVLPPIWHYLVTVFFRHGLQSKQTEKALTTTKSE